MLKQEKLHFCKSRKTNVIVRCQSSAFPFHSLQCNARNLPGPTELYKQCAFALLKAGRYEDAVTVCDKVLTTVEHVEPAEKGTKEMMRGLSPIDMLN